MPTVTAVAYGKLKQEMGEIAELAEKIRVKAKIKDLNILLSHLGLVAASSVERDLASYEFYIDSINKLLNGQ
jgi:hypothetical protein